MNAVVFSIAVVLWRVAPALDLVWTAPPACPDQRSVEEDVARHLSGSSREDAQTHAQVDVTQTEAGFAVRLAVQTDDAQIEREFVAGVCADAAETTALLIAMSIDPLLASSNELPEATTEPAGPEPEPAQPVPAQPVVPSPPSEPSPAHDVQLAQPPSEPPPAMDDGGMRVEFRGHLLAGVGAGPLPTATGAIEAGFGVGANAWQAEATIEGWTPSTGGDSSAAVRVRASLLAFGARGCGIPAVGRRFSFPLCAGLLIGPMFARGLNVRVPDEARTAWAAARLSGGAVVWARPWLGIGVHLSGHATLYRPRFATSPSGSVHEAAGVGVRGLLGVSLRNRAQW